MTLTKKDKIEIAVAVVAFILMLVIGIPKLKNRLGRSSPTGREAPTETSVLTNIPGPLSSVVSQILSGKETALNTATFNVSLREEQVNLRKQPWGRDPFFGVPIDEYEPAVTTEVGMEDLMLSAISQRGENKMAIVNNTIVRTGDEVFGMKVMTIERDRVIFSENNGQEFTLRFGGNR